MAKILVTGGAGFIGANYVRQLAGQEEIVVADALTYAANLKSILPLIEDQRIAFVRADIKDRAAMAELFDAHRPEQVVHFAAESHVDRSISGPSAFTETNVLGTQVLLDESRRCGVKRFVMVSTDEVYGSLGAEGLFTEQSPIQPSSPYSASKAGADLLALAYCHTFDLPVVVTRCSNNYGPLQFPEKLIPLMIIRALEDAALPVYGDGQQVRDWIHVEDHCRGIEAVRKSGVVGEVYNIGSRSERTNLWIVEQILERLGKPRTLIQHVEDRLGHDRRYAIDPAKVEALGHRCQVSLDEGLPATIDWYLENRSWWEPIRSGEYMNYFQQQYGDKLKESAP